MIYKIVEKDNTNSVHCICHTREMAERALKILLPQYIALGYFIDKKLKDDSFIIIEEEAQND